MVENDIYIHIGSGIYLYDYFDTDENLYEFLTLQSDPTKKFTEHLLRFGGSYKFFVEEYFPSISVEDQWVLDISDNTISKYLAATLNSGLEILRGGGDPIYFRHGRATEDGVMLQGLNENNWQDFLAGSIDGALTQRGHESNESLNNIFDNLRTCFNRYGEMFSEIADRYCDLLMSSSMDNILRVFKFLELPQRDVKHHAKLLGGRDLFHRCVVKYVERGLTPLTKSAKTLPDVNPPDYL